MYVYKKKCDEDYYLSLIQNTQQQFMYNNPSNCCGNPNYYYQGSQFYNNKYPMNMLYSNFIPEQLNYNYSFKTPMKKTISQFYNDYGAFRNNPISPSPIINNTISKTNVENFYSKKPILEDQILFNKVNNINDIKINSNKKQYNNNFDQNRIINWNNNENELEEPSRFQRKIEDKKIIKLEDFLSSSKKNNLNSRFNEVA